MSGESAIAIAASDGVAMILKKIDEIKNENNQGDSLMTKVLPSKLFSPIIKNCFMTAFRPSAAIIVFGDSKERQNILNIASKGAKEYSQRIFYHQIPLQNLSEFISNEMTKNYHANFSPSNPEVILTSWTPQNGSEIYGISNGGSYRYQACAIGDEKSELISQLGSLNLSSITTNQALAEGVKILMNITEGEFKFEVAKISSENQGIYQDGTDEFCHEILLQAMRN